MGMSSKQVSCEDHIQAWNRDSSLMQASNDDDGDRSAAAALEIQKAVSIASGSYKKGQPQQPQQQEDFHQKLNCPRCDSTNTKFCYYNNYNRSQPRHFCKSCKRHWTRGGTLRKVPVGGGGSGGSRRKTNSKKRVKTASTPTSSSTKDQGRISLPLPLGTDDDNKICQPRSLLPDRIFLVDRSIDFVLGRSLDSDTSSSGLIAGNYTVPSVKTDHTHQEIQDLAGFTYPSLCPLEVEGTFSCSSIFNSTSSTTQTCSSSVYGYTSDQSASLDETVIGAGLDAGNISCYNSEQLWKPSVDATCNLLQGWEEIDKFDISIPWDDPDMDFDEDETRL